MMGVALLLGLVLAAPAAARSPREAVDEMARVIAAETGQDEAALQRIESKLEGPIYELMAWPWRSRGALLEAVADKKRDWRLRRLCATLLQNGRSQRQVEALTVVLLDRDERMEVRGGAAVGLLDAAPKEEKVRKALAQVLAEPDLPRRLLDDVMRAVAAAGSDDLELMLKIADMPAGNLSQMATGFQGIRAISKSKDLRATELLVKLVQRYPTASLNRRVTIDELTRIAEYDPGRIDPWREQLGNILLKASYEEPFGRGNLDIVVRLLGEIKYGRATDRLIELLDHHDDVMVCRAAEALGKIGDSRALPAVQRLWDGIPQDPRLRPLLEGLKTHPNSNQVISCIETALKKLQSAAPQENPR